MKFHLDMSTFLQILNQYGIVATNLGRLVTLPKEMQFVSKLSTRQTAVDQKSATSPALLFFQNAFFCGEGFHKKLEKGDMVIDRFKIVNRKNQLRDSFAPRFLCVFLS